MARKTKTGTVTVLVLLGGLWLFYKKNWNKSLDIPHPETQSTNDMDEEKPGVEYDFYVELSTNLIYEVKLFDSFALARPANPWFYVTIRKIDLKTFDREFEAYCGDPDQMRLALKDISGGITVH